MSEAVAGGLIGATAALLGAFGVQLLAHKQSRDTRRKQLAALFLAALDQGYFVMSQLRRHATTEDQVASRMPAALSAVERLATVGNELALLVDEDLARKIRHCIDRTYGLAATGDQTISTAGDWQEATEGHVQMIVEMSDTLHQELRKKPRAKKRTGS